MSGQMVKQMAGVLVPVLGGGASVPVLRQDLVPGTYKADATNTGLLPGYTWTTAGLFYFGAPVSGSVLNGDQTITGTDTLLENKLINGRVICRGTRNTVRNCVIRGVPTGAPTGKGNGQGLIQCDNTCLDARLEDCEVYPQKPGYNWTGLYSHDFTAKRLNIYRCVDLGGAFAANKPTMAKFWGCWLHDMTMVTPDPNHFDVATGLGDNRTHNDVIQLQGGSGTEIIGCTLGGYLTNWAVAENFDPATMDVTVNPPNVWAPPHAYSASGKCVSTSCIQVTPNVGTPRTVSDNIIRANYFYGGAVAINYSDPGAAADSLGSAGFIQDNFFDHWQGLGGSATSTTGHTIDIGIVWTEAGITNNRYEDTLLPVQVRANLRGN